MNINEANYNLIQIGNAMIIQNGIEYYVIPRTAENLKSIYEYPRFDNIEKSYDYDIMLESNWEMYKIN